MTLSVRRCLLPLVLLLAGCHEVPQAPKTVPPAVPPWVRITMDDGVTDYPSFLGLDLMTRADTEFDFVTDEEEFNTLYFGGCVQNCQDPARWMRGVIDSGAGYYFDGAASSGETSGSIVVAYDVYTPSSPTPSRIRVATCGGGCARRGGWTVGDIASGQLGWRAHSRALTVDASGGLHLLYQPAQGLSPVSGLVYAHCITSCTDSASWQTTMVDSSRFLSAFAVTALPSGGVRIAAIGDSTNGLTYLACDSGCTSRSNWASLVLRAGWFAQTVTLLRGPDGALQLVAGESRQSIVYARCDSNCLTLGNWSSTDLAVAPGYDVAMTLDASGQPWIAATQGLLSSFDGTTTILHCAAGCGSAGAWTTATVDSLGDGGNVSIVIDAQGQPRVMVSGIGAHYAQRPDTTLLAYKR